MEFKVGRDYYIDSLGRSGIVFYIKIIKIENDTVFYRNYEGYDSRDKLISEVMNFPNSTDIKGFHPTVKKVKNTKLSRKMYPEHEIDGDYLIVEV